MTYIHEYKILDNEVKVEYCFSAVSDEIKVVDMWIDGKEHKINWMSHEGRDKLMARLEDDFTNRVCGTHDDDSMIEPFYKTIFIDQPVETAKDGTSRFKGALANVETEVDLDRDIPKMTPIVGEA